ncbi:MAG: glycosyltransferase family 4 protein [Hyphomonadaceae bacterium]|nr:glycosyltransferase family 4 protein [Hyphomonadaceae bacterium]
MSALDDLVACNHPLARELDVELIVPCDSSAPPALRAIQIHAAGAGGGHAWEQAVLPAHVGGGLLSLCNTGPLVLRKHIVCIHDANTRVHPASYSIAFRTLYRALLPALGTVASRVATVSHHSADQLVAFGISAREKILVAPDGHEHALRWSPAHSPATRQAAGPDTVVIIGSRAPHKNIGLIVGMAQKLNAQGLRVAVAGMSDARVFAASQADAEWPNVLWLGRLADGELAALLQESLCLAFPSFAEGFGLPALEAMTLGCPVVVSDQSSLPEVCGDAALYASPFDSDAWLACFLRLRSDVRLREELIARGRSRAALYSWRKSAETYLEAMSQVDAAARERA